MAINFTSKQLDTIRETLNEAALKAVASQASGIISPPPAIGATTTVLGPPVHPKVVVFVTVLVESS